MHFVLLPRMKPIKTLLAVVILFLFYSFSWMHPYHVSVTEITHNVKENTLEVSCKMFDEDIEEALKKINSVPVDVGSAKDSARVFKFLENYFSKHFAISLDGQKANQKFLGFERSEDEVWCYFEYDDVKSFKKVCVENTVLYDFIKEQSNMIHLITPEGRKSRKLYNPDSAFCFDE